MNYQIEKVFKIIKNPAKIISALGSRYKLKWMPDELYLKLYYRAATGEKLNLNEPRTFNEKLQWLKLYDRRFEYTNYVDKYAIREHIKNRIGEEYLIPLLGVYDKFNEINFNELPNQFVLKCTHDSGSVIICKDKSKLNIEEAKKIINKCLKRNYFYLSREWPYKNVKPRIICEKYLLDESITGLIDYKLMCFNGKVKCWFVCLNRSTQNGLNIDIYDVNWNLMPVERPNNPIYGYKIPKPKNFKKMMEFAEILSNKIPFIRVDFYEIKGRLYFGELTFYPTSGYEDFKPKSYNYIFGNWIRLPT